MKIRNFCGSRLHLQLEKFSDLFTSYRYIESIASIYNKPHTGDATNFIMNLCCAIQDIARLYIIK
ncbi:MAG: hypothetical protein K2P99_05830 [Burkholderiales bacterium]|nr:hypothetical protein [Burkholderiales bacterium]